MQPPQPLNNRYYYTHEEEEEEEGEEHSSERTQEGQDWSWVLLGCVLLGYICY